MILVDSSVWIDYFRGAPSPECRRLDALIASEPIAIGDLILAEVLQGFVLDRDYQQAKRHLTSLHLVNICGRDVAIEASRNVRLLRAMGITVRKTIDNLIATRCIVDGYPLLYSDRDFDPYVRHLNLLTA
jgi:predicted nucleic acid-binding protein